MSIYPLHFFTQPFCEAGDKTIPTDVPPAEGRTSLPLGFPPETQKPIRDGGIAPDRWDFNGILYMLSALAYWQQAGGQWKYDPSFPYEPPSFCYYGDQLWYCIGENGPGTKHAAPVAPGTDTTYWVDLLWFIAGKKYCSRTGNTIRLTGDYVAGTGTIDEAGECSFSPVVHQSDKLTTARSISLSGDVSGSASFDGSRGTTIHTTLAASQRMVPDWARMTTPISPLIPGSSYTMPSNGYVWVWVATRGVDEICLVSIAGNTFTGCSGINDWVDTCIPVARGDVIRFSGNWSKSNTGADDGRMFFIPAK